MLYKVGQSNTIKNSSPLTKWDAINHYYQLSTTWINCHLAHYHKELLNTLIVALEMCSLSKIFLPETSPNSGPRYL